MAITWLMGNEEGIKASGGTAEEVVFSSGASRLFFLRAVFFSAPLTAPLRARLWPAGAEGKAKDGPTWDPLTALRSRQIRGRGLLSLLYAKRSRWIQT